MIVHDTGMWELQSLWRLFATPVTHPPVHEPSRLVLICKRPRLDPRPPCCCGLSTEIPLPPLAKGDCQQSPHGV